MEKGPFDYSDTDGREYARISKLRPGDKVEADDGFTCIKAGAILEIQSGLDGELYVFCSGADDDEGAIVGPVQMGEHYLDGQLMDDDDHLIGFYKV